MKHSLREKKERRLESIRPPVYLRVYVDVGRGADWLVFLKR
jgi:hypothetical protein